MESGHTEFCGRYISKQYYQLSPSFTKRETVEYFIAVIEDHNIHFKITFFDTSIVKYFLINKNAVSLTENFMT